MKLIYKIYTFLKYYPGNRIKKYFSGSAPIKSEENRYKNILFCPFAPHRVNIVRESIWAHACRLRGANARMISYDLHLPAIDFLAPGVKKDLKVTYRLLKRLYRLLGLEAIFLSEYQDDFPDFGAYCRDLTADQIMELEHEGIKLGDLVIASTIRNFFSNGPEWGNPDFLAKAKQFSESALTLTSIFIKLIEDQKPDKIVASHGIYVSWGTLFRVASKMKIPIDIYGSSYRKDTLRFYHNSPNAPFPEGEWDLFKDKDLLPEELIEVDKYIKSRSTQSEDSVSLFSEKNNFPDKLRNFLERASSEEKKVFALFSNVSWDAYMFRKDSATFDNMVDWVNQNISYFKENTDACLIVKAHPAEKYFNVPDKYRIKNCISIPNQDNIFFLNEKEDIKPDLLYGYIDAGLIYTSTVSLEMALLEIPVISAGVGGHYAGKGFTIDPVTREDYFESIEKFVSNELEFTPDISAAKKYLYFRFYREALKNDLLTVVKYKVKKYNFKSLEDLLPGRNRELDIICEGILNDSKFIN